MNFSYDYEELLDELRGDVYEGLIGITENILVVRAEKMVYLKYRPIIDYYYDRASCLEPAETISVADALKEMTHHNRIIR